MENETKINSSEKIANFIQKKKEYLINKFYFINIGFSRNKLF